MKDDRLFLVHISECISRIERYTLGGKSAFLADTLVQDAVIRNLQVLAESCMRLSAALKTAYPETDWQGIAGFRNILVHDYLGINRVRVWEIVTQHTPALKTEVQRMLNDLGPSAPQA